MHFSYPGLDAEQVSAAREHYGSNAVTPQARETLWQKFRANFRDPIIVILLVALAVTLVLAATTDYVAWYEGAGIAIAVLIASLVSTWAEYSNESEFQRLLEEASQIRVKTFRAGSLTEIPINELVVGDTVLLQAGDTVPADGFLIAGKTAVSDAALTGETRLHKKKPSPLLAEPDEASKLLRASLVEDGGGVLLVSAVGDSTEYGKTLKELGSVRDRLSPLQRKLAALGGQISTFAYVGAVFIALAFMYKHVFLDNPGMDAYLALPTGEILAHVVTALILAIIIIVVAVPEGLPLMIAIVLSLNMRKLLRDKVLVRKLMGIETAGSLSVLFSDKTGTLTQGRLVTERFVAGDTEIFDRFTDIPAPLREALAHALRHNTGAVLNPARRGVIVGADRTEQALLQFLGDALWEAGEVEVVGLIAFSSARKFSAVQVCPPLWKEEDALALFRYPTLVKGAPEVLLPRCTHYLGADGTPVELEDAAALWEELKKMSRDAMRLIAVAVTATPIGENQRLPAPLTLIGICGIRDGLRETSKDAVALARRAGIQVVMITGDAVETAQAIARDIGLLDKNGEVLTSAELGKLTDAEVKHRLPRLAVVARAYPSDKSRLVRLAKELGAVVGMTGDGVNDAPALKHADVGFAMGSGTEITKEAGDIVILDDNFASLTRAVLYGRTLFRSIRKFLVFQLTVNLSAILLAFLGPFLGYDLPLTMIQLLWINLVMDTLAALAFAGEPALKRYMHSAPISLGAPLIDRDMWASILFNSTAATALSVMFLQADWVYHLFQRPDQPPDLPRTENLVFLSAFFGFFVLLHNFNKFSTRNEDLNIFEHILDNHYFIYVTGFVIAVQVAFTWIGGDILRTTPLTLTEWMYVCGLSLSIIPLDLLRKVVWKQL